MFKRKHPYWCGECGFDWPECTCSPSDALKVPRIPLAHRIAARICADLAWPLFLPLKAFVFFGRMPPTGLVRGVVVVARPLLRASLRLRGWTGRPEGVSGV